MRVLVAFLAGIVAASIVATLGILVGQNPQAVSYTFLGTSMSAGLGVVVGAAALLGFVLSFFLLVPGRLASAWRGLLLSRQTRLLEGRLTLLREERAQLQGSHQRLLEEHRHVMGTVLAPAVAQAAPGAMESARATRPVAVAVVEAPGPSVDGAVSSTAASDTPPVM